MSKRKNRVVTSLRVDPNLWKEAKIEAIKRGTTLASLLEKAIRNEVRKNKEEAIDRQNSS